MDYRIQVRDLLLDEVAFVRAVFSGRQRGHDLPWQRAVVRPVLLKERRHLQVSYFDDKKDITRNYRADELPAMADELLTLPFKNIHVQTTLGDLQVNISKKGRPVVSEHRSAAPTAPDLRHNRQKQRILDEEDAAPFLRAVGILGPDGAIKADMRRKYRQIEDFLRLVEQTGALEQLGDEISVADLGCGNAYLTFAAYYYLTEVLGRKVELTGVDIKDDLLARHHTQAEALGLDGLHFAPGRIADFAPATTPDIVLALHACDTATDEALARGIGWGSRLIVSAPCCHHHLQAQLAKLPTPAPFGPMLRHGILSERTADILTDTFRAQILGIMGYRTDVVQFVDSEHTPRNLMIRAVKTGALTSPKLLAEYQALKTFWGVTPYLETLLGGLPQDQPRDM